VFARDSNVCRKCDVHFDKLDLVLKRVVLDFADTVALLGEQLGNDGDARVGFFFALNKTKVFEFASKVLLPCAIF